MRKRKYVSCRSPQRAADGESAVRTAKPNGLLRATRTAGGAVRKTEQALRKQRRHIRVCAEWAIVSSSRVAPQERSSCPRKFHLPGQDFVLSRTGWEKKTNTLPSRKRLKGAKENERTEDPLQDLP